MFVAGDLVSLYAMLAMLTLGASGLVIHDETAQAWRSGSIYLVLALLAESVLLVGLVMLAGEIPGDSLSLRDAAAALVDSPHRDLILALLVAGFGTKAGLVPMHLWMPLAHAAAPVPASSVLSGAVVKVGIIGLIRFLPLSEALPDWGLVLTAAGFVTAFYAVAIGLTQRHPKAVLGVLEREPDGRRRRGARHGSRRRRCDRRHGRGLLRLAPRAGEGRVVPVGGRDRCERRRAARGGAGAGDAAVPRASAACRSPAVRSPSTRSRTSSTSASSAGSRRPRRSARRC